MLALSNLRSLKHSHHLKFSLLLCSFQCLLPRLHRLHVVCFEYAFMSIDFMGVCLVGKRGREEEVDVVDENTLLTPQPRVQPHPTWFVLDQHAKHFGPYQTKQGALQAANMIAMVG